MKRERKKTVALIKESPDQVVITLALLFDRLLQISSANNQWKQTRKKVA